MILAHSRQSVGLPGDGSSCSATQLCPTLCDSVDCRTAGFPVLHHPTEFPGGAS